MVYHGISRGCRTCKRRRKKCDEARPACNRCTKTKLTCSGYEDEGDLIFRRYSETGSVASATLPAKESHHLRICSLSNNVQLSVNGDKSIGEFALSAFLADFCYAIKAPLRSRGYLTGLEELLERLGPLSDVAKAARAAASAILGNKLKDLSLTNQASLAFSSLLPSFQVTMSKMETANTIESLTTAVLLGLYEIIAASKGHPGEHSVHFRGIAAILAGGGSVFSQHPASKFIPRDSLPINEISHYRPLNWPIDLSIVYPCSPGPSVPCLDDLLRRYSPVFRRGAFLKFNPNVPLYELRAFRDNVMAVDQDFKHWPSKQPKFWQPRTLGAVPSESKFPSLPWMRNFPGRVDVYFDLYVSTVWNSYRKCRLHLLSCISNCSQRLAAVDPRNAFSPLSPYSQPQILAQARELAENAAASVPFHLLQDPGALLCLQEQTSAYKELGLIPNKAVGGLLLMYSILAIGECDIVPMELRDYFRDCLIWIGSVMGIGQAGVVADPLSQFPKEFIIDGHMLVLAGTLIP